VMLKRLEMRWHSKQAKGKNEILTSKLWTCN
jgi:hypothetical protein